MSQNQDNQEDRIPDANGIIVHDFMAMDLYFDWSMKGVGFGQFSVGMDREGEIHCSSECMPVERCAQILRAAAERIIELATPQIQAERNMLEARWAEVDKDV